MRFLTDLYKLTEKRDDMSQLPKDVMDELRKNIRKGAEDLDQNWANALELVHKAYDVAGVERPTPDMKDAWEQYETNIQYAVEQLSKQRGMDGDWRMSSHIFHEAMEKEFDFVITVITKDSSKTYDMKAPSIDYVIEYLKKNSRDYDTKVNRVSNEEATIDFKLHNVKQNFKIRIKRIPK